MKQRLVLGTALATSAFMGSYLTSVRRAYAACDLGGGTYTCGGSLDATQNLDPGTALTVTTTSGFSIDTSASSGNAFTLVGTGGLTFTDTNGSPITGADNGIFAVNNTSGALSVVTTGTVTGTGYDGISALGGPGTTGLTIEAAVVNGGADGINARHLGTGALSITATGTVTGTIDDGIYAYTAGSVTGLTIEAAAVNGDYHGIHANHLGTGVLSITTTGTVAGTNGDGIDAASQGDGLTIKAVEVNGGGAGIRANNLGGGALSITTTGSVTGTGGDGIFARNYDGTDLTIEALDVSGYNGIAAMLQGSGALSITTTGTVTGTGGDGIDAASQGDGLTIKAAEVNGGGAGIRASHLGRGALSITTTGTVTGTAGDGISAHNYDGTDLTIEAVDVSGGYNGIAAMLQDRGALSITTTGAVTGTDGHGIYALNENGTDLTIEAADVRGAVDGIGARHYGDGVLSISATGAVTGTGGYGIFALTDASTTDLTIETESVTGAADGIFAHHQGSGALSISSTGTVTGKGTGRYGIYARNENGTDLTIEAADVSGYRGIHAGQDGRGVLSITTTGTVTGTSLDAIFAYAGHEATGLTIEAADVNGGSSGINALMHGTGALSIAATGTVTTTTGAGIYAYAAGSATDVAIQAVDVNGADGIHARHYGRGDLTITATGTVTGMGPGGNGISAYDGNGSDLTIEAVDVSGDLNGISARHLGNGALSITTSGLVTGKYNSGIYAISYEGSDLTIAVADVSSGYHGITAILHGSGVLSITASGTVTGGDTGIATTNDSASAGSATIVTVHDDAAVKGGIAGVGFVSTTGRAGSLENAGEISGATGIVAQTDGMVTITNGGTITGTGGTAIDLAAVSGKSIVNQRGGTVTGDILLSAGAGIVNVTGGTINGDIVGQGNADLDFAGDASLGAGFSVTGFDRVTTNAGLVDFGGTLSAATLTVNGGRMIVDGAATLAGGTVVQGGILSVNGSLSGAVDVLGGRLQGIGTVFGDTRNVAGGTVAPGNSIGTLTIDGDYTGSGGLLQIEAELGGDGSQSDLLVVKGSTSGSTGIDVANLGGSGAQTVEGIKVVDVGGASAGKFTLIGDYILAGKPAVVGGAYSYMLEQNGITTPTDGDWYLRSVGLSPGVVLHEAYAGVLQSFNAPGTLQQRLGNRSWIVEAQGAETATAVPDLGMWSRIDGAFGHFDPGISTSSTSYDVSTWKFETGLDMPLSQSEAGLLVGGLALHYGSVSSDVNSLLGNGSINATGYGLSGTLTWYGSTGFYLDGQARVTKFDSDLYSDTLARTLASGNDGLGYAFSLEAGQHLPLGRGWSMTPQVQLAYSAVDYDDFADPFGALVSLDDGDSLVGRFGLSADYEAEWTDAGGDVSHAHVYGIANLYYDFLDGTRTDVSGTDLVSESQGLQGGLGIGGSLSFANGKYALHGEALARTNLEDFDSHVLSGTVGFTVNW